MLGFGIRGDRGVRNSSSWTADIGKGEGGDDECLFCDFAWGFLGAAIGLLFLGIGLDLMMGDKVRNAVGGPAESSEISDAVEEVIDDAGDDD